LYLSIPIKVGFSTSAENEKKKHVKKLGRCKKRASEIFMQQKKSREAV